MAVSTFTRFLNIRNVININNFGTVTCSLNILQRPDVISKPYCTTIVQQNDDELISLHTEKPSGKKLNKAMKAYLQRSKDYKAFIEKQIVEYNIGKRHLANMMGANPDEFTQKDINKAIQYLFPSGLYDKEARPKMDHPIELNIMRKEVEFNEVGRPHHFLFYTTKPNYYEVLYNIADSFNTLTKLEDQKLSMHILPTEESKIDLTGTEWHRKIELEKILLEQLKDAEYEYLITSLKRLTEHPLSKHVKDFIMKYRRELANIAHVEKYPEPEYDSDDRPFVLVDEKKCWRKSSSGQVKVIGNGTGKISINGKDITYFSDIQSREQVIFPLIFTNMTDKVDVEATVHGGGVTGQAGVIRKGIALALRSFVDIEMVEKMRVAGLLANDWRSRERKKPGQEGARRKFTWRKR